jgi:hypothetical protein
MVSLTVLDLNKMGRRSVGMKHLFFIFTKPLSFFFFLSLVVKQVTILNHARLLVHLGKAWSVVSNVLL